MEKWKKNQEHGLFLKDDDSCDISRCSLYIEPFLYNVPLPSHILYRVQMMLLLLLKLICPFSFTENKTDSVEEKINQTTLHNY